MSARYRVKSAERLNAGDHIFIEPPDQSVLNWFTFGMTSKLFAPCSNPTPTSGHMLLVEVFDIDILRVIRRTVKGVKKEEIKFDAKRVWRVEYQFEADSHVAISKAEEQITCTHGSFSECNDEQFVYRMKEKIEEDGAAPNLPIQHNLTSKKELHKISSLSELRKGDHIREENHTLVKQHLLVIEVVDANNVCVIHKLDSGVVEETKPYHPSEIKVYRYRTPYDGDEIIRRARSMRRDGFSYGTSNCEHFVMEARTGRKQSDQVSKTLAGAGVGGFVAAGTAAGAIFGGVGSVPGAAVGAVVGIVVGGFGGGLFGMKIANK